MMNTKTLLEIVDNRIKSNDGNPTSHSFLYELHQALERLHKYEEQDSNNFRNNIEKTLDKQ